MFGSRKKNEKKAKSVSGIGRLRAEGLGNVWHALTGQNPAAIMPQVVGTVLEVGGTRPVWQWKRAGQDYIVMAWPQEQPIRAAVLFEGQDKLKPISAFPLLEGLPIDLTVKEVVKRPEGASADVGGEIKEDQNPVWFFDPLYSRDLEDLTVGVTHTFWLAAAAFGVRQALLDNITITKGPQYELYARDWLEQNPDKSSKDVPPLQIDVKNKRIIMPGRFYGEYEIRAVIEEIEDVQFDKMDVKVLYVSFPFENRAPWQLPIYASKFVLGDYTPKKGQEIDAYIWLQGRIIDMPTQE